MKNLSKRFAPDLREELWRFYETAADQTRHKPWLPLAAVAKNHRFLVGLCMFNRSLKHLGLDIVFIAAVSLVKMPAMLLFYFIAAPLIASMSYLCLRPIWESKLALRQKTENSNAAFKEMLAMNELTRSHGLEKNEYRKISAKVQKVQRAANIYDLYQIRFNNIGHGTTHGGILSLCDSLRKQGDNYD